MMDGMADSTPSVSQKQVEKFKEAARALRTDDDPERFEERLGKLVKHRSVEKAE